MENMENEAAPEAEASGIDLKGAVEWLRGYIARTKKSQASVAKELGLSGGALSAFISGTYKAPYSILPKVEQLIKLREKREASPAAPSFKLTGASVEVLNIITYCHLQGKIGVAYGDPGIGKTMAALNYCEDNPDAIMITTSPCYATVTGVNELLAEELRVREKTSRRMFSEIVSKLRGSGRVIIIDEAQHISVRVINHLRSITDASGVGIAFIGNEEIYSKMRGTGSAAYAQLFSRIGVRSHLTTSKIRRLDVELIFGEAELPKDALDILYSISRTNYGLRGAVNVFVNTIIGEEIKNYGDLTAAKIAAAAKQMNIP